MQLSSRTIKSGARTDHWPPCTGWWSYRQSKSVGVGDITEMLLLLTSSLLPAVLLCQGDTFDDELLLHPDLQEDEFSGRQTNSTSAATTSSLVFGVAAILLVTSTTALQTDFNHLLIQI